MPGLFFENICFWVPKNMLHFDPCTTFHGIFTSCKCLNTLYRVLKYHLAVWNGLSNVFTLDFDLMNHFVKCCENAVKISAPCFTIRSAKNPKFETENPTVMWVFGLQILYFNMSWKMDKIELKNDSLLTQILAGTLYFGPPCTILCYYNNRQVSTEQ